LQKTPEKNQNFLSSLETKVSEQSFFIWI
jgi:hypothetical protein